MLDDVERRTLTASAFIAGCLLIAPGQVVAAGTAWVIAAGLLGWHLAQTKKTKKRKAETARSAADARSGPGND